MKVLFYLYRYPGLGGIETVTTHLANYLYENGIEICFFSEVFEEKKMPLNSNIKVFHSSTQDLRKSLHEVLENENIDIVVLHDNYDADAITIVKVLKELHIPLFIQEHSDPLGTIVGAKRYVETLKMNNLRNILWRIKNFNYVSRVAKKYLKRKQLLVDASYKYILLSCRFVNPLEKCVTIVDNSKIVAINNPLTVPINELALQNKKKRVVFVSRLEGVKGVHHLVSIYEKCAINNQDWSFEIYGDGKQRNLIETLANNHNNISYNGVTNNVSKVLETASILVMTSSFEGWGLVLTEAMANGCIPMAFNSYLSVKDIIDDSKNGVLVSPFNINEYCEKLQALIDSTDVRYRMSCECIQKARSFDITNNIGKQWLDLLTSPIKSKLAIASSNRSHLLDVAREMSNTGGYDVVFYTFTPKWRLKNYNIDISHTVSLFWFCVLGILVNRIFPSEISRELQRRFLDNAASFLLKECDVLICQSPYFNRTMKKARKKYGAKIILDRGSTHVRKFQEYAKEYSKHIMPEWYMRFDEAQYFYADYIAIASEHVKNSFLDFGTSAKKLFVNPYGFDSRNFYPTTLDNSEKVFDLLYIGQWSKRKGCELLIDLCAKYGYSLLHVGAILDVSFPENLKDVIHIDSQPEAKLIEYYKKAKVFILASYDEGLSLVQAQAITCGLPLVISTRTGGRDLKAFVDNPEYIIEFNDFMIESIQESVEKALTIANNQSGIRDYAGEKIKDLDWKSYAIRYDKFIKKILK